MGKSYHSKVIDSFCKNVEFFAEDLGFVPRGIRTNVRLGSYGEIDIILTGPENQRALVEVKSHEGLEGKFLRKQLPIYREFDRGASIYLLFGIPGKSTDHQDFTLRRYYP